MKSDDRSARASSDLARLQSWMQMVITDAHGVARGLTAAVERAPLFPSDRVEDVVAPSATLTSAERLAIYSRSYHARLVGCFEAIFPCLRYALGDALFAHFTIDYLGEHPPSGHTLDRLADAFPLHLAATRPDAASAADARECWPDFIIDLATLEHAMLRVFDGPGLEGRMAALEGRMAALEGRTAATVVEVAAMPLHRVGDLVPARAPSLRFFRFGYRVHDYYRSWRRDEAPVLPAPQPCVVAVSRRNYRVKLDDLSSSDEALLALVDGRRTLREIARHAALDGNIDRDAVTDVAMRDTLCRWIAVAWTGAEIGERK